MDAPYLRGRLVITPRSGGSFTFVAANDFEQAQSRVFQTAVALIRHNPQ
jgi:hypothetical protein